MSINHAKEFVKSNPTRKWCIFITFIQELLMAASIPGVRIFKWKSVCVVFATCRIWISGVLLNLREQACLEVKLLFSWGSLSFRQLIVLWRLCYSNLEMITISDLKWHVLFYNSELKINISTSTSVFPSVRACVCHKILTLSNQRRLLINVVSYASVMKKIPLGSDPTPRGP